MIGGPFTQKAAGGDLGELSAEGIVAGQQAASTPIPLDPSYQAPPDTSRPQYAGGGIRVVPRELNPNRAYSAQEFYPGQERPNESRASGGDPIFAASSGRIPWGILADSANQVKRQRADLMKMVQGNANQFKGVAAPPYDIAYQNYVTDEYNKFKQARADALHGGDLDAATRELYTNPQANEEFQAFNRNLLAYGNANKYQFDQVADLLEKQRTGEEFVSPDTLEYAQRFMGGKMPFDDKATLGERAYDTQVLDRKISRDKLWNTVYLPRLKQEMDTLQAEGKVITKGGRRFLSETETRSLDRMKEQVVKDMVHKYGLDSEDEVRRFVDANTPRYEVTDLSQLSLGSSGGSTPTEKTWAGGVQSIPNKIAQNDPTTGVKRVISGLERMPVGAVVAGRQVPFKDPVQVSDGRDTQTMVVSYIDRNKDGEFVITGYDPNNVSTSDNSDEINARIGDLNAVIRSNNTPAADISKYIAKRDSLTEQLRTSQKSKRMFSVPLRDNEQLMNGLLGGNLQRELNKFGDTAKTTPEDFSAKWAKLPKGGKLVGPDGIEYEKK